MRLIFFILFMFFIFEGNAQSYITRKTADKKSLAFYDKAQEASRAGDMENAINLIEKAIEQSPDFIDAYLVKASIYYDLGQYDLAKHNFEHLLGIDPLYRTRVYYQLGLTCQKLGDFDQAAKYFSKFLELEKEDPVVIQRAKTHYQNARFAADAIKNPVPFQPIRLNENINTTAPEYLPALTADGNTLIFTRIVNNQEDFFISSFEDNDWQPSKPLLGINSPESEGGQSISADGKFLVFTACNRKNGLGSCDLFYSTVQEDRWTEVRNLGSPVNSKNWDSTPSISANGKYLFFASERPGGEGGRDIWVSTLNAEGWGIPQNLGPLINTSGDEQSPFIHADGQTLFFMSNGHPGMGNFDLYASKLQSDGSWGAPQNLGYPINTEANEGALIVALDGKKAFFASDTKLDAAILEKSESLKTDADIYQFELYPEVRPAPATYLKAHVFDQFSKKEIQAVAEIFDLDTGLPLITVRADPQGSFLVCLPSGKEYALNVAQEGYLFFSGHFNLKGTEGIDQPYFMEIGLVPLPDATDDKKITLTENQPIVLKNVFFESGSAVLKPISLNELNRLKDLLEKNPDLKIQIKGHTDNVGSESDNLKLSEDRAKAVYDYLVENGIVDNRLQFKGFGESVPIDSNDTVEGRQNNRRTEFVVIK